MVNTLAKGRADGIGLYLILKVVLIRALELAEWQISKTEEKLEVQRNN